MARQSSFSHRADLDDLKLLGNRESGVSAIMSFVSELPDPDMNQTVESSHYSLTPVALLLLAGYALLAAFTLAIHRACEHYHKHAQVGSGMMALLASAVSVHFTPGHSDSEDMAIASFTRAIIAIAFAIAALYSAIVRNFSL